MIEIVEHTFAHKQPFSFRKKTTEIILHCSADPEGRDNTVEKIDHGHKVARGFNCIGYQYVIYRDGSIHQGRPENTVGGHCTNHNSISVGVCYIGGMDKEYKHSKDTRTEAQKKSLLELVHHLLQKYKLKIGNVHAHNEFAKKACPSFKINQFRDEYKNYFGV